MKILSIDKFRYYEPLFEGVRIILNNLGESYTPEYIQGISGAAFKIAGWCPSRPTCVYDRWTPDFIRYLGYEVKEYPCFDENGNDITDSMIEAVKKQIDSGKPALVWHAFTNAEYDVVCGYDEEARQFIGRGTYIGNGDDYARETWERAKTCDICPAFGAIIIGNNILDCNSKEAEKNSLVNAVKHARKYEDAEDPCVTDEGIRFYYRWAEEFTEEGRERGIADCYCYGVYSSVRKAAVTYLRELAKKYNGETSECLKNAAASFERETKELDKAWPYVSWESPEGIDEERSKHLAPILREAAIQYEKGIEHLESALQLLNS